MRAYKRTGKAFWVITLLSNVLIGLGSSGELPTKSEAVEWLTGKLKNYSAVTRYTEGAHDDLEAETIKNLSIADTLSIAIERRDGITVYRVALKDLSPSCSVEPGYVSPGQTANPTLYVVKLTSTHAGAVQASGHVYHSGEPWSTSISEIRIALTDETLAKRVCDAFNRLITLSGGKKEPF